ncbi:MAG: hypothetical protein Q4A70_00685 [Candidatus Saccharibacteria bacterium]|nr:hypothetical protein [Candidatus Saccharibacteria bacterium]
MAQAKKKTATKTAKKTTARKTQCHKKSCSCTRAQKGISSQEKMHIYMITGMSIIAGILLCANAAMMMV